MNRLYKVEVVDRYLLKCTFFNGDVKEFDFEKYICAETDDSIRRILEYGRISSDVTINDICTGIELNIAAYKTEKNHKAKFENKSASVDYTYNVDADTLWCQGVMIEQVYIDDINIRLAEWFVALRELKGMTQGDLARVTGIYQAEISKMERGLGNPSLNTIKKMANGLGYTPVISFEKTKESHKLPFDNIREYLKLNKRQGDYTVEDMDRLSEDVRCELVNGCIYDLSMPSILHQKYVFEIAVQFRSFIRSHNGDCKVIISPFALRFEDDEKTLLAPDMAVVCNPDIVSQKEVCGAPDFILEVVSQGNSKRDYRDKLTIYRDKGVREYWILDPAKSRLVVYVFDEDEDIQSIYPLEGRVPVGIYKGKLEIDLDDILNDYNT